MPGFNAHMWPFKRKRPTVDQPPPRSPRSRAALQALRDVPGPSPWYLDGLAIPTSRSALRWVSAGHDAAHAGKSNLVDETGRLLAVSDFHCYVRAAPHDRMLAWYTATTDERTSVRIDLHDLQALAEIDDVADAVAQLGPTRRLVTATPPIAAMELSTAIEDGAHSLVVPDELRSFGELLVLASSTAGGRRENHFDEMHQRLWVLDLSAGHVEVIPQDWFNRGSYDFGYQWVTRMARLESGDIVGEGIRLGVFRLDGTNRQVAEWLIHDVFYHPERQPLLVADLKPNDGE